MGLSLRLLLHLLEHSFSVKPFQAILLEIDPFPSPLVLSIIYHCSLFYFSLHHLPLPDIGCLPYWIWPEIFICSFPGM